MNLLTQSVKQKMLAGLASLFLSLYLHAYELDVTGISAHISSGFRQSNGGIYLDSKGVYVVNPGLAIKNNITGYDSNWYGIHLMWQTGAMLECRLMPMAFIGPMLRLSLHLTRNLSVDFNMALSLMAAFNWQGIALSRALQPFAYPSLRYRGESGYGGSLNLAITPRNLHFGPTGGSHLLFLFFSLARDYRQTEPVDVTWVGFSKEEAQDWQKQLGENIHTVGEYADMEQLLKHQDINQSSQALKTGLLLPVLYITADTPPSDQ